MIGVLPEKDLIGLGYWGLGFRNATNSSRSIAKVEDFAGLKLRVIPNPVFLETFKALKANPVPMNFGELYTALENEDTGRLCADITPSARAHVYCARMPDSR